MFRNLTPEYRSYLFLTTKINEQARLINFITATISLFHL
jgi:hypothetical protein